MKKALKIILKTIAFFVGWALILPLIPDILTNNSAILRLWWEFVPLALIIIFSIVFVLILEKRQIRIPIFTNALHDLCVGVTTGVFWFGSVFALLYIIGVVRIGSVNQIKYLWIWIFASLFNVAMQELLIRGYLYQLYKKNYNTIIAIIITTILFTAMHGGVFEAGIVPVLNVVTMSLFVSVLLEYTGALLASIIAHFIWNTVGAIILGGVSLADDYPSLLNSQFHKNSILSGGTYKIEGSIIVLGINIIFTIALLMLIKRKKNFK